jgi:outer membrane immunogenic protein
MKNLIVGSAVAVALSLGATAAPAADMPVKAPPAVAAPVPLAFSWAGFYVGAHAGGGWGEKCFVGAGAIAEGCHDTEGWLAGGQTGYNWHAGPWVFGVEASGSWADLTGTHELAGLIFLPGQFYRSGIDSLFMATGRVGFAWDRFLAYVKGGGAWARERYNFDFAGLTWSAGETRSGWTAGAGLEIALTPNWSVGVEYNYVDFGDRDLTFTGAVPTFTTNIDQQLHIATGRLNYRFGTFGR